MPVTDPSTDLSFQNGKRTFHVYTVVVSCTLFRMTGQPWFWPSLVLGTSFVVP